MSASEMARVILENIKSLKPEENRVLIAIAGPPGSGKSTVGEILICPLNFYTFTLGILLAAELSLGIDYLQAHQEILVR